MKMGLLLSCIKMVRKLIVYQFDTSSDDVRERRRKAEIFTGGII